jgi:hypothetical protein
MHDGTYARQLKALRELFATLRDEERSSYPGIDRDPYLSPPWPEGADRNSPNPNSELLLKRFLVATDLRVDEACERLRSTIRWRRDWDVLAYYEQDAAQRFMSEASNPGAEVYIADSLETDAGERSVAALEQGVGSARSV